jgi:hypothetical protein
MEMSECSLFTLKMKKRSDKTNLRTLDDPARRKGRCSRLRANFGCAGREKNGCA